MNVGKCYGRAISIPAIKHQKGYYCKGGVWEGVSILTEDRAKVNSLKLHKGGLSNYMGCVTQKQLPKRT